MTAKHSIIKVDIEGEIFRQYRGYYIEKNEDGCGPGYWNHWLASGGGGRLYAPTRKALLAQIDNLLDGRNS